MGYRKCYIYETLLLNTATCKSLGFLCSHYVLLGTQNIVHGDIKPDNLLVTATGTVKIGDFSVSQVFEVMSSSYQGPLALYYEIFV